MQNHIGVKVGEYLIRGVLNTSRGLYLSGAETFNGFDRLSQEGILLVYTRRLHNFEIGADYEDVVGGVEEAALLLRAQKCAFEDLVTRKGFDSAESVPWSYRGRIAMLTNHGTLIVVGKAKGRRGRHVTMRRIHTFEYGVNGGRCFVPRNLELDKPTKLFVLPNISYTSSALRHLAMNPHGADGNELEACVGLEERVHEFEGVREPALIA